MIVVILAGLVAGFMNAISGGGSLITLPALVVAGLPALAANASSTVALFPGQVITAVMARRLLDATQAPPGLSMRALSAMSLVGGAAGAVLLLVTPPGLFVAIVPWLVLFATGVFARGRRIGDDLAGLRLGHGAMYAIHGVVSVYGGYFGGGIGILTFAALTVFGHRDVRVMNGVRIVLVTLMNVAAVVLFTVAGVVHWRETAVLAVASIVGGLVGIRAADRMPPHYIRRFVIAVGVVIAAGFLLHDRI